MSTLRPRKGNGFWLKALVWAISCSGPSLDNSLVISLWGTPQFVWLRLTAPPTILALGMVQAVNEGTARALIPWLGRPPWV